MSGSPQNHYQAMGLGRGATPTEIREAYLRLARTLHPDRFMDASPTEQRLAERRMREVNAAWAVLGKPDRRREYDVSLEPPRPTPPRPAASRPSDSGPRDDPDEDEFGTEPFDPADDVELSPLAAFLLRRGPIIVFVFVLLGLFIGTAYAGGRRDQERLDSVTTTTWCRPAESSSC
ncbi:MAG TPA: DnaJ domain-containing protein [Microthrixaceae bacterium]|nr:DnaJ domain-containing protein [Microthrixaceae bacterium]